MGLRLPRHLQRARRLRRLPRRKTEADGEPRLLHTVRGVGYVLREHLTLRRRLALMSALAVGVTVALASLVCYVAMRSELRAQVTAALRAQGDLGRSGRRAWRRRASRAAARGGRPGRVRAARRARRRRSRPPGRAPIAVASRRAVAGGQGAAVPHRPDRRRRAPARHHRPDRGPGAVQLGRSLESVDSTLGRLRIVLVLLVAAGIAFAAALGPPVRAPGDPARSQSSPRGRAHRAPPATSAGASPRPARTRSGRMARASTPCSTALRRSQARPAPAGGRRLARAAHPGDRPAHQHRGPARRRRAEEGERRALLRDMVEQSEELSALVADLIDLARGDERRAAGRGRAHWTRSSREAVGASPPARPRVRFATTLERGGRGAPERLGPRGRQPARQRRQVQPAGRGRRGRRCATARCGPRPRAGPRPEDELAHVFDRFYRGAGRGRCPARAWAWPSCGRSPRPTARPSSGPSTRRRAQHTPRVCACCGASSDEVAVRVA